MNGEGVSVKMVLCDSAQVAEGKLYVLGAGWSQVAADVPFNMALAALLFVPWNDANKRMEFRIILVNADGKDVPGPDGQPIRVQGEFEVGRKPGLRAGTTLVSPLAVQLMGMNLPKGVYRWDFYLGHSVLDSTAFDVG